MRNITRENHIKLKEELKEYHNFINSKPLGEKTTRDLIIIELNSLKEVLKDQNKNYFDLKELEREILKENNTFKLNQAIKLASIKKGKDLESKELGDVIDKKVSLLSDLLVQPETSLEYSWNRTTYKYALVFKDDVTNKIIHISHAKINQVVAIVSDTLFLTRILKDLHKEIRYKVIGSVKQARNKRIKELESYIEEKEKRGNEGVIIASKAINPLITNDNTVANILTRINSSVNKLNKLVLNEKNPRKIWIDDYIIRDINWFEGLDYTNLYYLWSDKYNCFYIIFEYAEGFIAVMRVKPVSIAYYLTELKEKYNPLRVISTIPNKGLRETTYRHYQDILEDPSITASVDIFTYD